MLSNHWMIHNKEDQRKERNNFLIYSRYSFYNMYITQLPFKINGGTR
jgi:hypothetical protein